jgi:HAD superfamily hydrolase (TIGR01509 family)
MGVGHMESVNLVIFDMDGLLFDTEWPSYLAMKRVLEKRDLAFSLDCYKRMIGAGDYKCDQILKELYGKEFSLQLILNDYQKAFKKIIEKEGLTIKPGVMKLLENLEKRGLKKCIASSSSRETIQHYLAMTGLTSRFDFYISGEEVIRGKPDPDVFIEAYKRANETSDTSLVLEDSLNGLRAAVGANIKCIVVPDLIDPNEEMKRYAYEIVADLNQVNRIIG